MSLGDTFINVFGVDPRSGDGGRLLTDDERMRVVLEALTARPRPCTLWISRSARLVDSHVIPSTVTLAFAPAALLTIGGTLTIRGFLDAGLEPRFELQGRGFVELLGPLEEFVADWWGPSGTRNNAVEHALDALWNRYSRGDLLPAPIRLDGPYALTRTLRIVPPADLEGQFNVVLRGQHGRPSDPPTFALASGASPRVLSSLLSVESGVVLTMERVAFDAGPVADGSIAFACVSLEGAFHRSRLESCAFRFANSGVRVRPGVQRAMRETGETMDTAPAVAERILAEATALSTSSIQRLELSRCLFTGVSVPASSWDVARGVDVGFGAPTALTVRDCQFVGPFASGVAILGGELDMTACQFANESTRVRFYDDPHATADVLVRRWGDETEYYAFDFVPKGWPIEPPKRKGVVNIYQGRPLSNTHVTITHCVSTSPIFLVMHRSFDYSDTISGGAVLTNVRHTDRRPKGVSVRLGAGAPSRGLVLQGCWFGGSVYVDPSALRDVVVDLGTMFDGSAGISNSFGGDWREVPLEIIQLYPPG